MAPKATPKNENVDTAGLDELAKLLKRIKVHGFKGASADEVWDSVRRRSKRPKTQSELRQSLEEAKSCMSTLREIQDHLGRRLRFLRKACVPTAFENGIKNLPDETLSQIFEAGHRMSEGWTFAKISGCYLPDQIQAFILRSGQMDLEVFPEADGEPGKLEGPPIRRKRLEVFFQAMGQCTNRWSRLYFEMNGEFNLPFMERLGLVNFPHLQYLYPFDNNSLSSWRLPLLSHVEGHHTRFRNGFQFLSQLTSFSLELDRSGDINALTATLYSLKQLKHFSLVLHDHYTRGVWEDNSPTEAEKIILDPHSMHIESLQIAILPPTTSEIFRETFDTLSFLSASAVDISLQISAEGYEPEDFLLTSRGTIFPYGSAISLQITDTEKAPPTQHFPVLTELVRNCKIAHSIHIEASMVFIISSEDISQGWKDFANLHHLSFKQCHQLTEQDVKLLVENLMVDTNPGMALESLELISCQQLYEEFLLDLSDEFGSKVKWKL